MPQIDRLRSRSDIARKGLGEPGSRLTDFLSQSNILPGEVTPQLRAALQALLDDLDHKEAEIEQTRLEAERHERLAYEDAFMPIGNRRAFVRELTRLIALVKRHGISVSIVYLDLNGMKQINDRYGHNAGDAALMQVARVLCEQVRESDVVARLGGDEFAVLLVRTDAAGADSKARALADAVAASPLIWEGTPVPLRSAYGTHSVTKNDTVSSALEAADQAMYRNKTQTKALAAAQP